MPPPNLKNEATPVPSVNGHFIAMLQAKTAGVTLAEFDEKLAEAVRAVRETTKQATLTYKLVIAPNAKRGVVLSDKLTSKLPEEETGVASFFAAPNGALLRNDPNQPELKFTEVPKDDSETGAPRVVTA